MFNYYETIRQLIFNNNRVTYILMPEKISNVLQYLLLLNDHVTLFLTILQHHYMTGFQHLTRFDDLPHNSKKNPCLGKKNKSLLASLVMEQVSRVLSIRIIVNSFNLQN